LVWVGLSVLTAALGLCWIGFCRVNRHGWLPGLPVGRAAGCGLKRHNSVSGAAAGLLELPEPACPAAQRLSLPSGGSSVARCVSGGCGK